jgi:hypothetical protein
LQIDAINQIAVVFLSAETSLTTYNRDLIPLISVFNEGSKKLSGGIITAG